MPLHYTGSIESFTAPVSGKYKMECWGAQGGGNASYPGGKGSYTRGTLEVTASNVFYIVVGRNGSADGIIYNNGMSKYSVTSSTSYWAGGGSTDIRLNDGNKDWKDFPSRKSRIMVAASDGGSETYNTRFSGRPGGTLQGFSGTSSGSDGVAATPGTQISSGKSGTGCHSYGFKCVGFGLVEYQNIGGISMGGAGNGYYCGGSGNHGNGTTGVGATGSCFISGYSGCNAITESSTENAIVHTGSPNHYSGLVFTDSAMIAGNASMPSPFGGNENGHAGDGACLITQTAF